MLSNATLPPELLRERMDSAVLFACFGALGVTLNGVPLALTVLTNLRESTVNLMLMQLCLADFLLSILFGFVNDLYLIHRERLPAWGCRLLGFLIAWLSYQEFVWPPLLSFNRYLSFYNEDWYQRLFERKREAGLITAAFWVLCAVPSLVFYVCGRTGYDADNEHCCVTVVGDSSWTYAYWSIVVVPLVCGFNAVMIYCNSKIYVKLRRHTESGTLEMNVIKQNRGILAFLWCDMALPVMFHSVYQVCKFALSHRQSVHVRRLFAVLFLSNSCIRGALTLVLLRPYRRALRDAFEHRFRGKRVNPDVVVPLSNCRVIQVVA